MEYQVKNQVKKNFTNNDTPLHLSAKFEDIEYTKSLLTKGAQVDAINNDEKTPLYIAIGLNDALTIAKLLLQHGANVNYRGDWGLAPLHIATRKGRLDQIELLIEHGADVNLRMTSCNNLGCTPLHLAVQTGRLEVIKFLLSKGSDVNMRATAATIFAFEPNFHVEDLKVNDSDVNGKTALELAVEQKNIMIIKILLHYSPDLQNQSNLNALRKAVYRHTEEIVDLLLEYGFTFGVQEINNFRLIHTVAKKGYVRLLKGMLDVGADVNLEDRDTHLMQFRKGYTLLHRAVEHEQEKVAILLIKYGAFVNAVDSAGNTPLWYAVRKRNFNITKLLIDNGSILSTSILCTAITISTLDIIKVILQSNIDVNDTYDMQKTPLHYVSNRCTFINEKDEVKAEIANLLLLKGAKVDALTTTGLTPLHCAAIKGYHHVVEVLLSYNANVNCISASKITPLHLAATNDTVYVTEKLLEKEPDVNAKLNDGTTALHIAARLGKFDIANQLLIAGADTNATILRDTNQYNINCDDYYLIINCTRVDLRTSLHIAAQVGCPSLLETILDHGANPFALDKHGKSALHIAAQNELAKNIGTLVKYGSDIDSKDNNGLTPIYYAVKKGYLKNVKILLKYGANINVVDNNSMTPLDFAKDYELFDDELRYYINSNRNRNIQYFIMGLLCTHIIKLKVAGMYVCPENLLLIEGSNAEYEFNCKKELELLKEKKISNNVSLYDVLKADISKLASFTSNEDIVKAIESKEYIQQFPLYAFLIYIQYRNGLERKKLLEKHKLFEALRDNMYPLPFDCYDNILSYLNNRDLKILIRSMMPLKAIRDVRE